MSRIGRAPIAIPAGVEIKIEADNTVTVKGAKASASAKAKIEAAGGSVSEN